MEGWQEVELRLVRPGWRRAQRVLPPLRQRLAWRLVVRWSPQVLGLLDTLSLWSLGFLEPRTLFVWGSFYCKNYARIVLDKFEKSAGKSCGLFVSQRLVSESRR